MRKDINVAASALMAALYLAFPGCWDTLDTEGAFFRHAAFMLMHGNLPHLAANCYALMLLPAVSMPSLAAAMLISCAASFTCTGLTVGFSGVIYAVIGMMQTMRTFPSGKAIALTSLSVAVTGFMPGIDWRMHVLCYIASLAAGRLRFLFRDSGRVRP